jgi:hypothetical protein
MVFVDPNSRARHSKRLVFPAPLAPNSATPSLMGIEM